MKLTEDMTRLTNTNDLIKQQLEVLADASPDFRKQIEILLAKEMSGKEETVRRAVRVGGHAVEFIGPDIACYGSSFSLSVNGHWKSLLSFEIGPVVARFTFVLGTQPQVQTYFGIVASFQTVNALTDWFPRLKGGAGWCPASGFQVMYQNNEKAHSGEACLAGAMGQKIVLEADGREGKRTLKLSQDGQTQPTFFSHIPVPFRFALGLYFQNSPFTIESLEVVDEPQMVGGTLEVPMDE
ncbi:hypothetical protein BLNAU_8243 [Blattamonas nauphoetae]|uniref:Uncharacterized protein n=1 Tax=Blattamonas nauphoetae TaxID=2049346 RepID=A0ABQ9XZ83_9EUKA|nr:hypothetical protein BLNAU_8243 [Blattamonas nauphoetae]